MKPCVLFDIDGTLADCRHRRVHLAGSRPDWAAFLNAMGEDTPNEPIVTLARLLSSTHAIVLVSGRNERHRRLTEMWLTLHEVPFEALYMRADGDSRADHIAKRELLLRLQGGGYQPLLVVDDRPSVVAMWRAEGLTCLQCAPDEEFER